MKFSLESMLVLIGGIAAVLSTLTAEEYLGLSNLELFLGGQIVMLSLGTAAAVYGPIRFRPAFIGAIGFGVLYFSLCLAAGFGGPDFRPWITPKKRPFLGYQLFAIAFVLSHFTAIGLANERARNRNR